MVSSESPTARLAANPAADAAGDLRLPKPPGVIRQFFARHPWLVDWALVVLYYPPAAITILVLSTDVSAGVALLNLVYITGGAAALLFRRALPVLALAVSTVVFLIADPDFSSLAILPFAIALYAVAVYESVRAAWWGFGASSLAVILGTILQSLHKTAPWVGDAGPMIIVMIIATLVGINIGNRKRYVMALLDRAAQLARERDQQAELAAAAERARIARELHDVVAHSLSVIVALSDGAEAIADRDPARSRAAMRRVSDAGRTSLQEMRRLLGVMGGTDDEGGQPLRPQPGMVDLGDLLQTYRSAGLPVRFETEGHTPEEPGLQLVVYRIVQESLTNVLRYASGVSAVVVRVVSTEASIMVSVRDDGTGTAQLSQGLGRGILGMTERAALYGGTLTAGPEPPRGWRVYAAIPLPGGAGAGDGAGETGDADADAPAASAAAAAAEIEAAGAATDVDADVATQTDGKGDE
ncbi:sensor histidine kinase [Compostimonas suwonensis]|uniref:histidine kinase n=1 Tax=Compostimonas suwonensis TaxID=1048394 RepID=A0A2M9C4T3_9MICO|nr:histidine kinase [Compostimonas suwonensis]PJJ65541.1 signal transduction histidine kinase [Compostimonas suwonensis]